MLDQTMKDIDKFQRDVENHKKEIEKLKKELEKYQKRDWLQGEEIIAIKRLAKVSLNDELVRKVAKKELKREQKRKRAIVEYSSSTDSSSGNEKPRTKRVSKARVKTKKHLKKSLGERENN